MIIASPCALVASHGASITRRFDSETTQVELVQWQTALRPQAEGQTRSELKVRAP
jgi:hypothetical protein